MAGGELGGYGGKIGWSAGLGKWLNSENSKVNRYWRAMEDGSGGDWSGRSIAGLWANSVGKSPLDGAPFNPGVRNQAFRPAFRKETPQTPEGMLGAARHALWQFMKPGGAKKAWNWERMDLLKVRYVWVYKYEHHGKQRSRVPGSGEMRAPHTQAEYRRAQQSLFHYFMTQTEDASHIPFVGGVIMKPIKARHYYAKAIEAFRPRLVEMEVEGIRQAAAFALGGRQGNEFQRFRAAAALENNTTPRKGRAYQEHKEVPSKYVPAGGAMVTVAASAQVQFSMRNGNGQFINGVFQNTLREVNARVAAAYLQEVADLMEFHRPSTGDLIRATLDRRNRYPDDNV